ncbi:LRRN4 C-terminal-like protein [Aulostomus maculatus]
MAASRDLPFPLMITCLLLIGGLPPTSSRATGTDTVRLLRPRGFTPDTQVLPSDDYYDSEDPVTTVPPKKSNGPSKRCNYDPCLDNEPSCQQLGVFTGCLCPGSTLSLDAPEPPHLKTVSWNGSEVVIHWCAPYSYVKAYIVTVGGKEWQRFSSKRRRGGVGDIEPITEVCVIAVNNAGASDGSCMMYQPRDNNLPLTAGLIGGALGLLLLLSLAVLLWRHKRQRKLEASISMRDTAESQ